MPDDAPVDPSPATGGMGGTGSTDPSGPLPDPGAPPSGTTSKADILFVVDDSVSMAPHQDHLTDAATHFLRKLAAPDCLDGTGTVVPSVGGICPAGSAREFQPVRDIHVGVISSSLGGHGSSMCATSDDRARLIPKVRDGAPDPTGKGYLTYDGTEAELPTLTSNLAGQIAAAGTEGCGFEAQLEAAYRFLVDPSPPDDLELSENLEAQSTGLDQEILDQRQEFLRDGSAVFVILLSDENDCSAMDGGSYYNNAGFGWLTAEYGPSSFEGFPVASPVCESDPNDECCFSCLSNPSFPEGCDASVCAGENVPRLPPEEDRLNVRCFEQKRRFGVDLLYPVERYIDGLSQPIIVDARTGEQVRNPLYLDQTGRWRRSPKWVFFTSIVGVPWQDLATAGTLEAASDLEYLGAAELAARNVSVGAQQYSRWDLMIGDQAQNIAPLDPFMIESIDGRSGNHPLQLSGGGSIASIIATDGTGKNAINGHEVNYDVLYHDDLPARNDLQYACIYPLGAAALMNCAESDYSCDCGDEPSKNRPVCKLNPTAEAPATDDQHWARAYPGRRILQVVEGLAGQGVPASICPKVLETTSPSYGYRPAMDALSRRLPGALD